MSLHCGCCTIIPIPVLERLAAEDDLPEKTKTAIRETLDVEAGWRRLRAAHRELVRPVATLAPLAATPAVRIFDCKTTTSLPGTPVANPGSAADGTAKRTFAETDAVVRFYKTCFGRNSIDGAGMTLLSSIHYGVRYNNAFWNGSQMTYGDGDGALFVDFTNSNDVIAHELTHGVTQYTTRLGYENEPGALNESLSDVFGSMFRQWEANQTVDAADWLIGANILGPRARARGWTCLRDLSDPHAAHCMSPQPNHYANYVPGGDPHINSGIPNRAFQIAAMAIGGRSWEKAGRAWYGAMTSSGAKSTMKMKAFAKLTVTSARTLFPAEPNVAAAITMAWKGVGVLT